MRVIKSFTEKQDVPIALTIGNFDGIHLGHQKILDRLQSVAKAQGLQTAVMTFSPHPSQFFQHKVNFLINSDAEKLALLEQFGVDNVYLLPFNQAFASLTAETFIDKLVNMLNVRYLLVGDDFRFGFQGKGDYQLLTQTAEQGKFELARLDTQLYDAGRISSTRIRQLLTEAELTKVSELLGRQYGFSGQVEHGQKLGRTLGFPTANISIDEAILLPLGVFAVKVYLADKEYNGVCNIGNKPSVSGSKRSVEVHLFDFNEDVYGKTLTVSVLSKLRDEMKFASLAELQAQIAMDAKAARELLEK